MKCAYCQNEETKVIETRENSEATRHRRECLSCEKRFTTYEKPDLADIMVIKKHGSIEPFDREKLRVGISISCEKTDVTQDQIDQAVDEIELSLKKRDGIQFTTRQIGSLVLRKLKKLDQVAYIRFASVHREFADVASFEVELKKMIKTK